MHRSNSNETSASEALSAREVASKTFRLRRTSQFASKRPSIQFTKGSSLSSMNMNEEDQYRFENRAKGDHKLNESHIVHKPEGFKSDIHFESHVNQRYKCRCNVCTEETHKKKERIDRSPEAAFFANYDFDAQNPNNAPEKDFIFILKRLFSPKNMTNGLRLNVPDTACFIQGECRFIVSTGKEKTLKFMKQKDKLTLPELRKYFEERRRRKEDEVVGSDSKDDVNTPTIMDLRDSIKVEGFGEVSPATSFAKAMKKFTYSRTQITETHGPKEVGLIRFKDDSATMLSESEFNYIMLRRKIDPLWKQIQYMQSFVKIRKAMHTGIRVYFVYEREKGNSLFTRAFNEVRFLNGEILKLSEDYIAPEDEMKFEEELKITNEKEYCLYLLMKIYHFLEVIYGVRVLKMGGDFVRDENGLVWLTNISRVEYQQIETALKSDAPLRNAEDMLTHDIRDLVAQGTEDQYKDTERKETLKLLNNILKQHYENIRRLVGMDIPEAYYDDKISDDAFARLHPSAPFKLSEILRSHMTYEEIREFIINNSRKLLFPNSTGSQGMSPELLAKSSYAGCIPKPPPGVIIKKSRSHSSNQKQTAGSVTDRMTSSPRTFRKTAEVIATSHRGIKAAFNNCFTNTMWNLKPNVRETYIQSNNLSNESRVAKAHYRAMSSGALQIPRDSFNMKLQDESQVLSTAREQVKPEQSEMLPDWRKNFQSKFQKKIVGQFEKNAIIRVKQIKKVKGTSQARVL